MVWKKRYKLFIPLLLAFLLTIFGSTIPHNYRAQADTNSSTTWSNQQWEDARKGIDYDEKSREEKPNKKDRGTQPNTPTSSWDIKDSLSRVFTSPLGKIISLVLIVALLVYTVFKILIVREIDRNKKVISTNDIKDLEEAEENLPESDLERHLRLALEKGDFKLAMRILFLQILQKLNEKGSIQWKKDKTNRDYLHEMKGNHDYDQFSYLTLAYEIIWYGDTQINAQVFNQINQQCKIYIDKQNSGNKK